MITPEARPLGSLTSEGSGLLVMMVVGGAIVPVAQGYLTDVGSYRASFLAPLLCYAVILYYGMSAERMARTRRLAFHGNPETR